MCPREQRKGKDRAATLCLDLTSEYLQGFEHRSWGLFWEITPVVVGCAAFRDQPTAMASASQQVSGTDVSFEQAVEDGIVPSLSAA